MAENIEHRDPNTVMESFSSFATPEACNYAIFCGAELRTAYQGGNIDEATERLNDQLNGLKNSNTNATYKLRLYPNDMTSVITNKSNYIGSTTFNFGTPSGTRDNSGQYLPYIPGTQQVQQVGNSSNEISALAAMVKQQNELMMKLLQDREEDKIDRLIGAIEAKNQQPAPVKWYDKIGETLSDKNTLIEIIGLVKSVMSPQANNIQYTPINGTTTMEQQPNTEVEMSEELQIRYEAAINKLLERFGPVNLVSTLESIAGMSDVKINAIKAFM